MSNDTIQLSLICNAPPEPSVVKTTLTVHKDLQWDVYVYGNLCLQTMTSSVSSQLTFKVWKTSKLFAQIYRKQLHVKETVKLTSLTLLVSRGGVIENNKSITAYLDITNHTARHYECALLCDGRNKCSACQKYRSTLCAMKSRKESSQSSKTASSSHANYRYL